MGTVFPFEFLAYEKLHPIIVEVALVQVESVDREAKLQTR